MKNLQYFLNEEQEEPTTAEKIVDDGIDKDEKKQIEEDAEEAKRIAADIIKSKEKNGKED